MRVLTLMKWHHWVIAVVYSTMLASLSVTVYSLILSEPIISPFIMKFHRVWGFLLVVSAGANFAFFGKFAPLLPSLGNPYLEGDEKEAT